MKIQKYLICFLLIIALMPVNTQAAVIDNDIDRIVFDDGSYIIIETHYVDARAAFTRSADRVYTYYNSSDVKKWEATLVATFTYNGTSCTCASSSLFINILDDAWYVVSEEATKSGNVASCEFTMGYKFLGITVDKKTGSMSITCDKDGNLS